MPRRPHHSLLAWLVLTASAFGQVNNNQGGNAGGIRIDADGVVQNAMQLDRGGQLDRKRRAALTKQALPGDVSQPSELRIVSLVRLETACAALLKAGKPLPPEIQCLAGLTRLDRIFVNPDDHDLLIAGPAEPFLQSDSGRTLGIDTGRPVLLLDDLLVALRTVPRQREIGCSIDPVPERLAALQQFLKQNSTPTTTDEIEQRFQRMQELLGNHRVRIMGVPEDSHFARGLLEADYRMKLLALGVESPNVKGFKSHLALLKQGNAIQRWWFVPLYDGITRTPDGLAFEFAGQRAQLLGEDELSNAAGQRSKSATSKLTTQEFSKQFTEKFPRLAEQMPVFAELAHLIDWAVFAALVQRENLAGQIGWSMTLFVDAEKLPHQQWPVPRQTACLMNTRQTNSGMILGSFSGGVTIRPEEVLREIPVRTEDSAALNELRTKALNRPESTDHDWWWDVNRE